MATLKEVDHTAVDGSEEQLPTQEEAVWEQTPERRHVDVLLDLSEEDFMKELEPHKYHCYSGWEEAVHGWARVSPLSCILLTQKGDKKSKPADNPTALPADPTLPDANGSTSMAEHRCESRVGLQNNLKKSIPLNQHTRSVAAMQKDGSEWSVLNSMQKTTSKPLLREKLEKEGTCLQPHHLPSRYSANRATQTQKHRCTVVPIQNFTFLPPIISPSLNPQRVGGQLCSGKKAQEGETTEENNFIFDAKSGTRGSRVDHIANPELPTYSAVLTSKYWTCPHNPHLFSAVSVSIPERYHVPVSSKPDTVHRTSYSAARSLTQALLSSTASGAHLYPSKTVCL
ncbi:uncharacterized protein si:ch73-103b9.2 [Cyclopterus lumpus]|uniref:uncharacterized protein si:ch73-103b9.2 n=1 Tax=Cyclopterus lumpus TaxID=8103 RepID=UPI0014867C6D|nr:uncharacterized protein si:ch73-103b9.2 [Cyclopterus lumpus]